MDEKYINFEELNINITLALITEKGLLSKKAKDEINSKVDKIVNELETIRTMQNSDEILAEYLKHKNLSLAIKDVNDRHFVLETLKEAEKAAAIKEQQEQQAIEQVEEVLQAPTEEAITGQMTIDDIQKEKIGKMTFTVIGTISELTKVKEFLEKGGYRYEQCK
jgi:carbamoylphosphate synthase small subunit